jgi:hypothetical protein
VNLIAFDPGTETGWATGTIEDGVLTVNDHGWEYWWPCGLRIARTLDEKPGSYDEVVFEGWRLTKDLNKVRGLFGSDMPWSQFIGIMKHAASKHGVHVVEQPPAFKTVVNNRMAEYGKWLPASEVEHNRDALRHLIGRAIFGHHVHTIIKSNNERIDLVH